jgi:plasmid stabilization system protein ParE
MSYQIVLSALAIQELEAAVDWYNECEPGLGKRFIEAIDKRLGVIAETPGIFAIKASGYNEIVVEKFPFLIVYKIIADRNVVRVLHIFHTSRNPNLKI